MIGYTLVKDADTTTMIVEESPSKDAILHALEVLKRLQEATAGLKDRLYAAAKKYIEEHGDIRDGDRHIYLAPNKTIKSRNNRDTMAALLEVTGGDVERIVECLASDAFKPGESKKALGEEKWGALFETRVSMNVKTKEPSQPALQDVDYAKVRRFAK